MFEYIFCTINACKPHIADITSKAYIQPAYPHQYRVHPLPSRCKYSDAMVYHSVSLAAG